MRAPGCASGDNADGQGTFLMPGAEGVTQLSPGPHTSDLLGDVRSWVRFQKLVSKLTFQWEKKNHKCVCQRPRVFVVHLFFFLLLLFSPVLDSSLKFCYSVSFSFVSQGFSREPFRSLLLVLANVHFLSLWVWGVKRRV